MWCPKCKQQYATDVELLLMNGKIVYKWKCKVCGSENISQD
jgi:transposase-like protein